MKLEEVYEKARSEARRIARMIAEYIKEAYWSKITTVAKEYDLEPKLGIELNGVVEYIPVLYLFTEKTPDEKVREEIFGKLGEWVSDARLRIYIVHKDMKELVKEKFITNELR